MCLSVNRVPQNSLSQYGYTTSLFQIEISCCDDIFFPAKKSLLTAHINIFNDKDIAFHCCSKVITVTNTGKEKVSLYRHSNKSNNL